MKSIEQLKRLDKIPGYTLTDEEKAVLESSNRYRNLPDAIPTEEEAAGQVTTSTDLDKKKLTEKNVAAKEIGKVEKHPSDPAVE